MRFLTTAAGAAAIYLAAGSARAAFIVEAHSTGLATANFSSLGHSESTTPSAAAGRTASGSVFGNPVNTTGPDQYTFSYTPGTNVDNVTFTPGTFLGDTSVTDIDGAGVGAPTYSTAALTASGDVGGGSGEYNVYITWPASANVSAAGSLITITSDAPAIELNPVNMNTDQTDPPGGGSGGNNAWLKIGQVDLTAGSTYTVTVLANEASFVSQRVHGVLWERVIPEPSSLALATIAAVAMMRRTRRCCYHRRSCAPVHQR